MSAGNTFVLRVVISERGIRCKSSAIWRFGHAKAFLWTWLLGFVIQMEQSNFRF